MAGDAHMLNRVCKEWVQNLFLPRPAYLHSVRVCAHTEPGSETRHELAKGAAREISSGEWKSMVRGTDFSICSVSL